MQGSKIGGKMVVRPYLPIGFDDGTFRSGLHGREKQHRVELTSPKDTTLTHQRTQVRCT